MLKTVLEVQATLEACPMLELQAARVSLEVPLGDTGGTEGSADGAVGRARVVALWLLLR